jgi:hypothetical protein
MIASATQVSVLSEMTSVRAIAAARTGPFAGRGVSGSTELAELSGRGRLCSLIRGSV